jgi:C4-dicarboxylate-specific signal transduction histidine kinase
MLLCLPLVIASMAPTDQPSVIVSGVGGLAWILGLEVHQGHSAAHIASWLIFSVVCSSIAVWATELHRRSDRDRLRADADRLAAMKRLAEQDRKEARTGRLALLGQLAATVSHEVNNPLAFVTANVSYLGGLLRASGVADDRLEVLEDTTAGLERIGNTIRMLQIFVQPAGGPATGNITEAVGEGLALAAGRLRRVQVQSSVAEGLPLVAMGHRRLVQLIVNLLLNAGEAVEGSTSPQVAVTVTLATGWVQLVVEDSGRGERRPTPSDFRAGSEPTGLGLALCREHVEEVGGSIALEVRPEGGSRVTVALPASSAGP